MQEPQSQDQVFANPQEAVDDFAFNEQVVSVFDDMVSRSVPMYGEIQRMTAEIAGDFAVEGASLYDLGCSTGTTMIQLDQTVRPGVGFVGIDDSDQMLDKAREKIEQHGIERAVSLHRADLHHETVVENASVVTMLLTLQFMRPLYRERVVKNIADGINDGGCFILVEKLVANDSLFNRLFIKYYYDYKGRRGYTEMEIAKKREALENVLIPYRLDENLDMLRYCGFRHAETFFRWYNFCGILAVK